MSAPLPDDYRLVDGLYYKKDDNSGPYFIDDLGVAFPLGSAGSGDGSVGVIQYRVAGVATDVASGTPLPVNLVAASGGVTINVDEADLAVLGTMPDASATTDTGTFSIIAFIKRGLAAWTTRWAELMGVASGAADSGNPIKVGGKYNSTLPTFTDGQRGDFQIDLISRSIQTETSVQE